MTQMQFNVEDSPMKTKLIVVTIVLVFGLTPLILYWFHCGPLPTVTPKQAKQLLRGENSQAVLVDVRPATDFASVHIDGALNWPLNEILGLNSQTQLPKHESVSYSRGRYVSLSA